MARARPLQDYRSDFHSLQCDYLSLQGDYLSLQCDCYSLHWDNLSLQRDYLCIAVVYSNYACLGFLGWATSLNRGLAGPLFPVRIGGVARPVDDRDRLSPESNSSYWLALLITALLGEPSS